MKAFDLLCVVLAVTILSSCREKPSQSTGVQAGQAALVEALRLEKDSSDILGAVIAYVPKGTDKDEAAGRMTEAGFTCLVLEDEPIVGITPTTGSNSLKVGDKVNVVICKVGAPGGMTYQVVLELDDAGKVKFHSLSGIPLDARSYGSEP